MCVCVCVRAQSCPTLCIGAVAYGGVCVYACACKVISDSVPEQWHMGVHICVFVCVCAQSCLTLCTGAVAFVGVRACVCVLIHVQLLALELWHLFVCVCVCVCVCSVVSDSLWWSSSIWL